MQTAQQNVVVAEELASQDRQPFVNEVTSPVMVLKAAEVQRPRILQRREARWARRACH